MVPGFVMQAAAGVTLLEMLAQLVSLLHYFLT